MIRVNTVEQYKILQHIYHHFVASAITITLVDWNTVAVTDSNQDVLYFKYENGQIIDYAPTTRE